MTIIDRASLDGATKDEVRQRFRAWCETEVTEGNGQLAAPTEDLDRRGTKGARYRYCICDRNGFPSVRNASPAIPWSPDMSRVQVASPRALC